MNKPGSSSIRHYFFIGFCFIILLLVVHGFFLSISSYIFIKITFFLILISLLIIKCIKFFDEIHFTHIDNFELSLLFIISVNILVELTGGFNTPFYDLNYLLAGLIAAFNKPVPSFLYILLILIIEIIFNSIHFPLEEKIGQTFIHAFFLLSFGMIFGALFHKENKNIEYEKSGTKKDLSYNKLSRLNEKPITQDIESDKNPLAEKKKSQLSSIISEILEKNVKYLEDIKKLTKADSVSYFLLDEEKQRFSLSLTTDNDKKIKISPFYYGETVFNWVVQNQFPLTHNSFINKKRGIPFYSKQQKPISFVAVPVIDNEKLNGILYADTFDGEFTAHDETIMKLAGNHLLNNLKFKEQLKKYHNYFTELSELYNAGKDLNSTMEVTKILEHTIHSVKNFLEPAIVAAVILEGNNKGVIRAVAGENDEYLKNKIFEVDNTLIGLVIKHKEPIFKEEISSIPLFGEKLSGFSECFVLIIPIVNNEVAVGAIAVVGKDSNLFINKEYEINILKILINHCSTAISNARMYSFMEERALMDSLTGLYNHRYLQEQIEKEIIRSERYKESLSFMIMDIDFFKKINDTYGHPAGDTVLKKVSELIKQGLRQTDIASRYGGEEFAAILLKADLKTAYQIADRIRRSVENQAFIINAKEKIKVTLSGGIANYPHDTDNKKALIDKADQALYYAKKTGRNKICRFEDIKTSLF